MGGELVLWPDRRLEMTCEDVPIGMDCSEILDTMQEVKREHHGIGIAAPQIGELWRIIVVEDLELINPVILKKSDQMRWVWEGCLSFPKTCPKYAQDMSILREGQTVRVRRHKRVKVQAYDRNWQMFTTKGTDWKGACLQHEIDHLNGITLNDYMREY